MIISIIDKRKSAFILHLLQQVSLRSPLSELDGTRTLGVMQSRTGEDDPSEVGELVLDELLS